MQVMVYLLFGLVLLSGLSYGESNPEYGEKMNVKNMIQFLNFSKTLTQDGEIKFLFYEHFPVHPDDVGDTQRFILDGYTRQLRENRSKREPSSSLTKEILTRIELEKEYGYIRDKMFTFVEGNLVFQDKPQYGYRMEMISRLEIYPTLEAFRYYNAGSQHYFLSNSIDALIGRLPEGVVNDRRRGYLERCDLLPHPEVMMAKQLPPTISIKEMESEVSLLEENAEKPVYVITYRSGEKIKKKVFVKIEDGLPQISREETYYQSESPLSDAEGYWLRLVKTYSDYERVDKLNISFPKVREVQEFRDNDGFLRRRSIMVIKEMDFNLGFPIGFFDWDESELTDDNGKRKKISENDNVLN